MQVTGDVQNKKSESESPYIGVVVASLFFVATQVVGVDRQNDDESG